MFSKDLPLLTKRGYHICIHLQYTQYSVCYTVQYTQYSVCYTVQYTQYCTNERKSICSLNN